MEKHAGKRERIEESDERGKFCLESEVSQPKRLCKECTIDVVSEIMSQMDNEDLDLGSEETEEEMVWDIMKTLEEEISPSPSCSDDTETSINGSDELESSGDKDCIFNAELDYLFGASDDELGIPGSPSVITGSDYDYNSCGFFECFERELVEQQLLLQIWLDNCESVKQDESDLFCAHDLHIVSNQIELGFCNS
ncbi:hypothetical protein SUGI_0501440 [Cryptomeria japonica]|nr:hypothetical protein SUGI_0501440 [Cryptomeria japonica]